MADLEQENGSDMEIRKWWGWRFFVDWWSGCQGWNCFSMIVSFMACGMVWEVREKVGNSYFIRKGQYECQMHMSTRTRDEKSVLTGRYKLKF